MPVVSKVRRFGVTLAFMVLGARLVGAQTSVATTDPSALLIEYTGPTQLSNDSLVMRIRIRNRTGRARRWNFEFNAPKVSYDGGGRRSHFELEVGDGEDRRFEILVPLPGASDASWVQMFVYGDGVVSAGHVEAVVNTLSSTVAISSGAMLDDEHVHQSLLGNHGPGEPLKFVVGDLAEDWRAYTSLAALWLSAEEWSELAPGVRRTLTEWVVCGGRLVLVEPGESPSSSPIRRRGMGAIVSVPAGLTDADVKDILSMLPPAIPDQETRAWVASLIEPIETHKGFLSLLLLGYLVLAGPVNLFVFSRGVHRVRLFWTMPTIALAASVVMAGVIVLQDGVGGEGVRSSFVYLQPELNRELVVQEQVSRTGALLRRGFELPERVHIMPLSASSVSDPDDRDQAELSSFGRRYTGDWFQSRSVQAQRLQTMRASRARIDLVSTETSQPALLSSIDVRLEELYFRDNDNRLWRAENVFPGRLATLEPANENDYERFWRDVSFRTAGPRIRAHTAVIRELRGTFLAKAAPDDSDGSIETLASIDWSKSSVLYAGHIDRGGR